MWSASTTPAFSIVTEGNVNTPFAKPVRAFDSGSLKKR
jgi:hypothetical protein